MELSIEPNDGGVARVRLAGRIVQDALSEATDPLQELLGEGAYGRNVILNLADATFIDSSGVGWLLKSRRCFREASGGLVLHSVSPIVSNMIRVMRLDTVLRIVPDEQAAMIAVKEK
jgi:anti-sigma B factor antagonist